MKMNKRRGTYILEVLLATTLSVFVLGTIFEMRKTVMETGEQERAARQLTQVAKAVESYLEANKTDILEKGTFEQIGDKYVFSSDNLSNPSYNVANEISKFLPEGQNLDTMRSVWGDSFYVVFQADKQPGSVPSSSSASSANMLTTYVVASGNSRHTDGSNKQKKWLNGGVQRMIMNSGSSFGYVTTCGEKKCIKSAGWKIDNVPAIGLQDGDLVYLVAFNSSTKDLESLSRYPTDDQEDATMYADINMNNNNLLNIKYLQAQTADVTSLRVDPTLYEDLAEAENSCENNWIFIRGKDLKSDVIHKYFVDQEGIVYTRYTGPNAEDPSANYAGVAGSEIGTFGMDDDTMQGQVMLNNQLANAINNIGRLYYIAPKIDGSRNTDGANAKQHQLAICRQVGNQQTLAFFGDDITNDKVAFVVTAVDGDVIPKFKCPGENLTIPSGNGFGEKVQPRLFVMPQIVGTGKAAFPLHGIRAWAEDSSEGWKIHLSTLVDTQKGKVLERSYWVDNSGSGTATETKPGGMEPGELAEIAEVDKDSSREYLRVVVMGVCSAKTEAF